MGRRNVYGNDWSENGWPMVDDKSCQWVTVPGTDVNLQIQTGIPLTLLRAFAADFHARIEPLRNRDSACFTWTNSVGTSNHLSGTAMDLNWDSHPFRVENAGFDPAKLARLRDLLKFYEYRGIKLIWWGNDWQSPKDAMHFQVGYDTFNHQDICNEFIARFIRADGFSTYQRGNAPMADDPALILSQATGLSLQKATEILPALRAGLIAAECTNTNRIAMYLAQVGHESVSFQYTEEIAKNGRYAPYIGRTWIQITWDYNYRAFSEWCFERGLVTTPDYFVRNYRELADLKWAGIGAAWYWTEARGTRINEAADRRDLYTVTQLINGGQNGAADRAARYERALSIGDRLLALVQNNIEQDEFEALMADNTLYPSKSPYRDDNVAFLTLREALRNMDGNADREQVETAAIRGHVPSITRVAKLARGEGPGAENPEDVVRAQNVIRIIQANIAAQTGATK